MAKFVRCNLLAAAVGLLGVGFGVALQAQNPPAPRKLAEGVLTTITPEYQEEELWSSKPLVEVPASIPGLSYTPNYEPPSKTAFERAKTSTLRRTVWNIEFSFKPLRLIQVDVPQANGTVQRKLIWYMCYKVKNNGNHWKPKKNAETPFDGIEHTLWSKELTNDVEVFGRKTTALRFFPHFVLHSAEYNEDYLDKVIPAALEPIRQREFPRSEQKLFNSLTIAEQPLEVSDAATEKSLWGVVTWEDVDPRIDYFSVFVQGLTNAYRYEDPAGAFKAGDAPGTGRKLLTKTLRLNFWRPGDTIDPSEDEIRYGVRLESDPAEQAAILKQYGLTERLDHSWFYQ